MRIDNYFATDTGSKSSRKTNAQFTKALLMIVMSFVTGKS